MDPRLKQEILSILDDASDMTIATVRKDGYPQATTVSYVNDGRWVQNLLRLRGELSEG